MKWRKMNRDNQPPKSGEYLVKSHCSKGKMSYVKGHNGVRMSGNMYIEEAWFTDWENGTRKEVCFECNSYEWLDEEQE